jgi:hypothetical protein
VKLNDFKDWSKRNYKHISKWEEDVMDKPLTVFEKEGFL